jgi:translocation and assembly module TamB
MAMLGVAALAAAAAGALLWLAGTESGTTWLANRLLAAAPTLTIERVRGSLLAGLRLEGVRLTTARDELDIESLALDWNGAALLTGTLAFERAAATRASYRRLPAAPAAGPPPELPWPLRIEQASIAALSVTIAERTLLLDATSFAATYSGGQLELEGLRTNALDAEIAGDATIGLRAGVELAVAAEWSAPLAGAAASGAATLTGTWPTLRVRHEQRAPFAAATDGTLDFAGALRVDLVTEWQALAWPGVTALASPSGRLALTGELGAYRYDGAGMLEVAGRSTAFAVRGTGERLELAIERLELEALADDGALGTLVAAGTVSLTRREADLALTANRLDPKWIAAAWPGRLDGTAILRAGLLPEPHGALETIDLDGTLRGYPVTLRGAAALPDPATLRLDAVRLESDGNHAVLTGTLGRTSIDLAVDAQLQELDLVLPGAQGSVTADLTIDGTWQEPRGNGQLAARMLSFAGVTVERLDASGELGLAPATRVALTIEAAGIERGPVVARQLRIGVDGTAAAHATTIDVTADGWRATLAASGGVAAGVWRGTLDALRIDEQVLGPWRLEAPAALALGRGLVTLTTSCLLHVSRARWCTELDVQGVAEDRLVVSGQNFDLATLRPLLPPALSIDGVYQISGALFDLMGDPRGALALTGGATRARVAFGDEQAFTTELDEVRAGLTLTAGRLELTASVGSSFGGSAEVRALIDDVRAPGSAIDGALRVEWPDLAFIALLSPEIAQVAGTVAIDLAVAGTVAEPTLDGRAEWAGGRIVAPRWGLVIDDIDAAATSNDGRALDFNATARAGDGSLTLTGATALDPDAGWPTRLELRGDAARLVQLSNAEVLATPDLHIEVALPRVTITGAVHVPRASLEVEALPAQAVTPSPDAVVHGGAQRRAAQPLQVRTNVELTLGDDVRYTGLNLDTTVTGQLRLATEPNRSADATGTLRLVGTYDAYGQKLDLQRGQLLFGGPLDDPGLDVRAVRTVDTTEVGVELTGTLKAPRTRIFSSPAMSEADALSYLLFGRPASGEGIGTEETSTLQTAALSLGLQQALPVVQRFGTTLGLDELTVQTTTTDAGALMAGKYLSPKLYIRYSYGLFNRIGGLLLRFKVNERLSIETRSGEHKSMDLLYTVEKD